MQFWQRFILLFLFSVALLNASVTDKKIVTKVQVSTTLPNYKHIAKNEALGNLSTELYSIVKSHTMVLKHHYQTSTTDKFATSYDENITVTSTLPIISPKGVRAEILNGIYVLTMEMDFQVSGPSYMAIASELVEEINKEYRFVLKLDDELYQKKELKRLKQKYLEYKTFALISLIMGYKTTLKPRVTLYDIETRLEELKKNVYLGEPVPYSGYEIQSYSHRR